MMNNIRTELLEHTNGVENIKAVQLALHTDRQNPRNVSLFHLPEGYSSEQLQSFLFEIDRMYDAGYGTQELYGFIWWKDGTWSSRFEYDGSERWEHHVRPTYPLNREEMLDLI